MFKYIAIILITVSLFCSCAQQKETTSAIPVILDTDVGNDIDDVLAMQMLLNYEKKGKNTVVEWKNNKKTEFNMPILSIETQLLRVNKLITITKQRKN